VALLATAADAQTPYGLEMRASIGPYLNDVTVVRWRDQDPLDGSA